MFDLEYLKSQTVLFVEDEELARDMLAKILSKIFKTVITAANGLEGLEKFKEAKSSTNEIDLIISDINMPIMNGLDMLENIREIDAIIPVIFVTARNETSNILRAIDLNVSNYIIKPVQTDILLKKIADACEKKYISKQLDDKKEELENYLEAVDHVALIYRMDDNGKITFGNSSFLEESLYTKEELENLNLTDLIHPDIPKDAIDKTWEFIRKGEVWSGNTKFITKDKEIFYLKNTIFKLKNNSKTEYITIGFSTTKESTEKREFQKKVVKSIQEFNKREYSYKKLINELNDNLKQLESYIPRLQQELEEQKAKTMSKHRQLEHYEMQMHNVDEKYYGHMTVKSKEVDEYSKIISTLKQEKTALIEKNKDSQFEIEATKRELALLTKTGEQKNKRINNLSDVIRSLESKIRDLTNPPS
jgi:PAS domain S-box-containing protein